MVRLFLTDSRNLAKENRQSHIYSYRIKSVHWVFNIPKTNVYTRCVCIYKQNRKNKLQERKHLELFLAKKRLMVVCQPSNLSIHRFSLVAIVARVSPS